jgi:hypothetical protein
MRKFFVVQFLLCLGMTRAPEPVEYPEGVAVVQQPVYLAIAWNTGVAPFGLYACNLPHTEIATLTPDVAEAYHPLAGLLYEKMGRDGSLSKNPTLIPGHEIIQIFPVLVSENPEGEFEFSVVPDSLEYEQLFDGLYNLFDSIKYGLERSIIALVTCQPIPAILPELGCAESSRQVFLEWHPVARLGWQEVPELRIYGFSTISSLTIKPYSPEPNSVAILAQYAARLMGRDVGPVYLRRVVPWSALFELEGKLYEEYYAHRKERGRGSTRSIFQLTKEQYKDLQSEGYTEPSTSDPCCWNRVVYREATLWTNDIPMNLTVKAPDALPRIDPGMPWTDLVKQLAQYPET